MKQTITFKRIHYEIIDYLNKKPFSTITAIAKNLNYDRTTISKRLKELRVNGVLGKYSTHIKSEVIGFPYCVYIFMEHVFSKKQVLDLFENDNNTIMIERTGDCSYIVQLYLKKYEEAYDYLQKCREFCNASLQIILHAIQVAHPVYPPYLFEGAEEMPYDPIAWRKYLPDPNNNLKLLSKQELQFFKLISETDLPYNLSTFCDKYNYDLSFATATIKKLMKLQIICGFDLQVRTERLGLEYCEHIIIKTIDDVSIHAIKNSPNIKMAYIMTDESLLFIIFAKDKKDMDYQLARIGPLNTMKRYQVQKWIVYPHNVLPQS